MTFRGWQRQTDNRDKQVDRLKTMPTANLLMNGHLCAGLCDVSVTQVCTKGRFSRGAGPRFFVTRNRTKIDESKASYAHRFVSLKPRHWFCLKHRYYRGSFMAITHIMLFRTLNET